jgi:glycogen(starch) synthase
VRVLMLSWEYPPVMYGGLGRHAHALAEALAGAGHAVTVVTQHAPDAAYDEVVNGVRVIRVPPDPPLVPREDLLAWVLSLNHSLGRAASQIATQSTFDVVHVHDWVVAHAAAAVKNASGLPLVATMHATEAGRHQGWLPGALSKAIHTTEWWLTFEARRVITCSSHMRWEVTRLFDLPPDSVDVVPNGIQLDTWHVPEQRALAARREWAAGDAPLVAYTGRLEYEKGVHTLLQALPRLRRRFPGVRLVLAGTGTHENELRALARSLRLGRAVTFAGFLDHDELAVLAAAADVAVVPSIYEPFGIVALEAAAAGTPLVVADTGGLREIVEHGITGLRFAPGDIGALATAVASVLSDEVLARRLGRDAREVLTRDYAWSTVAARTAAVYARAIREERALQASQARPLRIVVRDGNLLTGESS